MVSMGAMDPEPLRPPTIDDQVGYDGRRAYGSWVARYVLGSIEVAAWWLFEGA